MLKKLKSEQLPTDGGFKIIDYLDKANSRLKQLGKHGKRATLKQAGNSVVLQFNFGGQIQRSPNCSFNKRGIDEAEKIAAMVTNQLVARQYSDEWLDNLLGKSKPNQAKKQLTCSEMIKEYKEYWFRENKKLKRPTRSWYVCHNRLELVFNEYNKEISLTAIEQVIQSTDNNTSTRTYALNALTNFLDYFRINRFSEVITRYKKKNKPQKKNKYTPSDLKIVNVFENGFKVNKNCPKKYRYRHTQWQFLYGLLAVYGLRIHEAWNIANWNKPVILKNGDWVEVGLEDESGKETTFVEQYRGDDEIIPAITDPNNKLHILAIKHDTKTGYRMAMPLSPLGYNWLEMFDLIGELRLPNIENPLQVFGNKDTGGFSCTNKTCQWFLNHKYGFTPHALRHAYNHRAHQQNLNPKLIADSLGHSLQMNQSTYLNSMNNSRKVQMMKQAISQAQNNLSEAEILRQELEIAKDKITYLETENNELKTRLKIYEAIKDKL